jgi:branched-chain amino acid transport system permease protein
MDMEALGQCVTSASCLVTQGMTGMIAGLLLFLVASGLTLIFGVLGFVNFVHGSFYMIGAYFAYSAFQATGSYLIAVLAGALGVGVVGIVFERFFASRVYDKDHMLQILLCYAFILIFDDLVEIIWGKDFLSMGVPPEFVRAPYIIFGGVVPPLYLYLIGISLLFALGLSLIMWKTKLGKIIRAAAQNRNMVSALGINTTLLFMMVFALGAILAGASGALAAPVRSLTPNMGFSILIESFIVTVVGGMGSIAGSLVASLLIGMVRSFGGIGFPLFTEGLIFMMTGAVLLLRPNGLFARRED